MSIIHQADSDIDINKLHLASPIPGHSGTYFSKLLFGSNDDPFYIQTPRCRTKQGIIKTGSGKKRYTDLLFSTHNDNFISLINSLEETLQQMIFSKQKLWFVSDDLEIEDIQNSFTSPIKVYKGKNYLLRVNLNQSRSNIENSIPIFNESEVPRSLDNITDKTEIISILEILGIKFTQRNFQIEIGVKQIMLIENSPIFDQCLIKPDNVNVKKKNLEESLEKSDNDIDIEDSIERQITDNDDNDDIEHGIVEDNVENVVSNNGENEEDSKLEIEDEINDLIEKDKSKKDDGLEEIEIKLNDEVEDEKMDLKKPIDIYMNMYLEARQKAKEAKKIALEAELAANNIRDTYALNIDDEEDDN